jgi:hypothetical protein
MSFQLTDDLGLDYESTRREAQTLLTPILKSNFPATWNAIFDESKELGQNIRELKKETKWIVNNWLESKPLNLYQNPFHETEQRKQDYIEKIEQIQKQKANLRNLRNDLFSLFAETSAHKRGKDLERVLNRFFKEYQISIMKEFKITGEQGEGVIEQVGGIIEIDNSIYLVVCWIKNA